MSIKKWILFVCILIANVATAQTRSVSDKLELMVLEFFSTNSDYSRIALLRQKPLPSESIIISLKLDSMGKIGSIHLMAEEDNRDSGYATLTKLKPAYFKDWQDEQYKNKTIVIPVVVANDESAMKLFWNLSDLTGKAREVRDIIVGRGLILWWPEIKYNETTPSIKVNPK